VSFALIPGEVIPYVKFSVPFAELLFGGAIAVGISVPLSAKVVLGFLVAFTAAVITKVLEGAEIRCGCFGVLDNGSIGPSTVIRNLGLMVWGTFLAIHPDFKKTARGTGVLSPNAVWPVFRSALNYVAILLLLVTTLALALQNRSMKVALAILNAEVNSLKVGETAYEFPAKNLDGRDTTIRYSSNRRTVLFVMKSSCKPCAMNLPYWSKLARLCQSMGGTALAVSMDSSSLAKRYATEHDWRYPIVSASTGSFRIKYKVITTPHTIVLVGDRVMEARRGQLSADDAKQLADLLLDSSTVSPNQPTIIQKEEKQ
jgi:peroxiredoxin